MELQIKRLRKRAGFPNQATLAKAVGVSTRSIQNWEQGVSEPTISQAFKLSEVLKCTLDELVGSTIARENLDSRLYAIASDFELMDDAAKDLAVGAVRGMAFSSRR